jgi:cell division transport system permease protein
MKLNSLTHHLILCIFKFLNSPRTRIMSNREEKFNKRRLRTAYFSVSISIALVLFMIGVLSVLVLNARTLAREMRENFTFTLLLKADAPEVDMRQLVKELQLMDYVKETEFISKDEAAEILQDELGEDFVDFLGYNPLSDALDIRLNADYVVTNEIEKIKNELSEHPLVTEVVYDPNLIQLVNENIERIGLILLGAIVLLLVIAIALINSSIRLTIYSRRFLIKTMQLVGATKGFIQKPFLARSVRLGTIGAFVAALLLAVAGLAVANYLPEIIDLMSIPLLVAVFGVMLTLGILISLVSTWFAVNKFLKLKTDEIYY